MPLDFVEISLEVNELSAQIYYLPIIKAWRQNTNKQIG